MRLGLKWRNVWKWMGGSCLCEWIGLLIATSVYVVSICLSPHLFMWYLSVYLHVCLCGIYLLISTSVYEVSIYLHICLCGIYLFISTSVYVVSISTSVYVVYICFLHICLCSIYLFSPHLFMWYLSVYIFALHILPLYMFLVPSTWPAVAHGIYLFIFPLSTYCHWQWAPSFESWMWLAVHGIYLFIFPPSKYFHWWRTPSLATPSHTAVFICLYFVPQHTSNDDAL